jgi:alkylated DNA repair protein alkB family protein 1
MSETIAPASSTPASSTSTSSTYKKALRKYLKSSRNRARNIDPDWTPFRAAEKQYKARFPPPDLGQVLDLALLDPTRAAECSLGGWKGNPRATEWHSLRMQNGHVAYTLASIPGV